MTKLRVPLAAVLRSLEEAQLGELLFFPELTCLGDTPDEVRARLTRLAKTLLEKELPALAVHRRVRAGEPRVVEVEVELEPPRGQVACDQTLEPIFRAVCWEHDARHHVAYVPALGIEVVATSDAALQARLPVEIRQAVQRHTGTQLLARLVRLQQEEALAVEPLELEVERPSPKQIAAKTGEAKRKPVLEEVGVDLTRQKGLEPAYEVDDLVQQVAEALSGRRPRSVLLVGRSGVGKSALVHQLVRARLEHGLRSPFWETSGSRLVAGMSGFGEWQARCQRLQVEAKQKKAVLCLGNLVELMEVGKSVMNAQGVASFLRPYLARGDMLAIVECTPEQLSLIERTAPHLVEVFLRVDVPEPSPETTLAIMEQRALVLGARLGVEVGKPALDAIDRLHRRYATYSASPGRPLRFLQNLLRDAERGEQVGPAEVMTAFSRQTGLPPFLVDDAVRLDLGDARRWFEGRVMGQARALDLVVDLLATVKSGLNRPRQPIASMLFIGPTGVGKTETAKALAAFLFGDESRLTRLDMSEYQDPLAVDRLVGGVGSSSEGILTARVREQPFLVVLLDEFEKAHPLFFDLLLQVLGEGRLTDERGRVADFTNAVVIMTSNLGARRLQKGGFGFGEDEGGADVEATVTEEVRRFLRPELFNRIDRIVPFQALAPETVVHIARRELGKLERREGIRYRDVALDVAPGVAEHLSRRGFDPRYGARPLKRVIERELVVPLAEALNGYAEGVGLSARVSVEAEPEARLAVVVRPRDEGRPAREDTNRDGSSLAREACTQRRKLQLLEQSPSVLDLTNELFRLERLDTRTRRKKRSPRQQEQLARLTPLRKVKSQLDLFTARVTALEEQTLFLLHRNELEALDPNQRWGELEDAREAWRELLLALYALGFDAADEVSLGLYSEDHGWLVEVAEAYLRAAQLRGYAATLHRVVFDRCAACGQTVGISAGMHGVRCTTCYARHHAPCFNKRRACAACTGTVQARATIDLDEYVPDPLAVWKVVGESNPATALSLPRTVGLVLFVEGKLAMPVLASEDGLHVRESEKRPAELLVDAQGGPAVDYVPPAGIERKGGIGPQAKRRIYDVKQGRVVDPLLNRSYRWGDDLGQTLAECLEDALVRALERQLLGEEGAW